MSRFLPRSLVGQLLLLVAAMLLAAQAINAVLLFRGAQNQNRIEASASAVARVAGEMERLEERETRGRREGQNRPSRFRRNRPDVSTEPYVDSTFKRLPELEKRATEAMTNMGYSVAEIRASQVKNLPPSFRNSAIGLRFRERPLGRAFASQRDDQEIQAFVLISAKMSDGRWLNLASAQRDRNPRLIRNLIFQTILLYLLLLIPLMVLGRFISKPLKALTQNARDFDPSKPADEVAAGGPPDVQQLIQAFNVMQSRVSAMLNEKDVMLGAIGHDLRTPLAALRVRIESVENDDDREKMIAGIEDMDQTLDDILSLARIGRSGSEAELTDISALIETVVDEFVDMGKQVSFERRGRINAQLRATLVRRALRNLISNAVKYGKSAEIAVEKTEDKLVITVDDIGPGIPDDQMENMFEPFARAEASRNRASGGSGLGLTLPRAIARDHGGDVKLKNRNEGGLRASLILES